MGFLKKLFGGGSADREYVDKDGIYLFFRHKRAADAVAKVRIDKNRDLNNSGRGYVWHKTIVDPKYFSRISAVVEFTNNYEIAECKLDAGELIAEDEYEAVMNARAAAKVGGASDTAEEETEKSDV